VRHSHPPTLRPRSVRYHLGQYSRADFQDLKRILMVFIPLPVYWALFYQQNSTWTDQADDMNTALIWHTPGRVDGALGLQALCGVR
jgi:hypothetical protein